MWLLDAFTFHVYQQYVSGKPLTSAARAALDYFQVPDAGKRIAEYAQHKQRMVGASSRPVTSPPIPTPCVSSSQPRTPGMLIADASSSKNAALFLRQIRLDTFAQEHGIFSPTLRPGLTLLADRPVCLPGEAILKAGVAELVDRLDDAQHVALAGIFEEPHEP